MEQKYPLTEETITISSSDQDYLYELLQKEHYQLWYGVLVQDVRPTEEHPRIQIPMSPDLWELRENRLDLILRSDDAKVREWWKKMERKYK